MSEHRGQNPSEGNVDEAVLADWVAELVERLERGEPVDLNALAEDHPAGAEELRLMLPTIQRMASFGQTGARAPVATKTSDRSGQEHGLGMLGDFLLIREVGRGGMGIVYEAEQLSLHRRVALKILPLAATLDHRHHQRFLLEASEPRPQAIHHTHIVPVHAVGSERGVPFYAMQFIDGCTLAQVVHESTQRDVQRGDANSGAAVASALVPEVESQIHWGDPGLDRTSSSSIGTSRHDRNYIRNVADLGKQAAEALDHAHTRGILHRDIKPGNLMFDADRHLWITDFGLAQIQGDSRLTITGDILGTLRYMSPEQALAKRVVIDGRTDLYSLGATLYELLTLQPVFDGKDRAEILRKITQDEATPVRKLNHSVPRDLETIVQKTLAKEPAGRYATAKELADDLGRFLDSRSITARPPGRLERLGKWARRNRSSRRPGRDDKPAGLAFLALAGGSIWSNNWLLKHNERLRIERDRANELARELTAQRDLAERRTLIADQHLYAFRLRQASEALRARQFEKSQEILLDLCPEPGQNDLREFAWRHLWRESRREVAVVSERTEHVRFVALSADGRIVATGDRDGTTSPSRLLHREIAGQLPRTPPADRSSRLLGGRPPACNGQRARTWERCA